MKKLWFTLLLFVFILRLAAQSSDLNVQSEGGKLYLNHTVAPKENLYSIGRLYNISPKEIAPLNGLTISSGLEIDQVIKIPLTVSNFTQQGVAKADETFVPLYHTVTEKEGLFRIGQNFNKVSADNLKKWNGLTSENISSGQQLVIGFLRVKKELSSLAAGGISKIGGVVSSAPPAVAKAPAGETPQQPVTTTKAPESAPVNTAQGSSGATVKTDVDGTGFFKGVYQQQSRGSAVFRSEMGAGSIFKSTSGWQDAKYYALMNNIPPGTIVRITNSTNNRTVFAKVLGELPPGKENEGLLIRISNAAAAELKVPDKDPKFSAEIAYAKG
ncbi:MAG: LysM peptidoglycan-binding domain-containing protein [Chitinophagaceae bacterium]|nr:LysM peptidoglycan-binding domain-containing protein [Chitinophagaceae bacterium]